MRFIETSLPGAWVIEPDYFSDVRGAFACTFTRAEMEAHGCNSNVVECNVSLNTAAGTLRGMHFQLPPRAQSKLLRCTAGAIWDCVIDLRPQSPTFTKWFGIELTAQNRRQLYIPEGFAHGFVTLCPDTEVLYLMGNSYSRELSRGVRWDDPAFGIRWPRTPSVIIDRDNAYPDFTGTIE